MPKSCFVNGGSDSIIAGVTGAQAARLDKALADASGLSRERVKALLGEGRITVGGKAVSQASLKLAAATPFAIAVPEAAPATAEAQDIPLVIVYEDEELIVIDKPAGLVVHPAAGNLDGTLVNALLHHCRGQLSGIGGVARPGIVTKGWRSSSPRIPSYVPTAPSFPECRVRWPGGSKARSAGRAATARKWRWWKTVGASTP
jgi:hypothetical protein